MGEFDRQENAPKAADTRKAIIALVLGVVLIGLVAHWYLKQRVGAPAGAPAAGDAALPALVMDEDTSPAGLQKLLADLKNDPTASLMQSTAKGSAASIQTPRDPFRLAPAWAKQLTKVTTPVPVPPRTETRPESKPVVVPVEVVPQGVNLANFKLTGTSDLGGGNWTAIINNNLVHVGDTVGKAKVLEIHENTVILQHVDFPNGPKAELRTRGGNPP